MQGGTFLYPALLKTVILPPALVLFLHGTIGGDIPILLLIFLYLASWPTLFALRAQRASIASTLRARRLGARVIPRVRGRLPLNFDVLLDWSRSGSEEEVGRMMVLLGRTYGRTLNTRVLGEDSIISTDPVVIRHVLIEDFDNFVKGKKFYQRAEGFLGDGIFNSDGERWKFHRGLTRPFFHPSHISPALFAPLIRAFMADLPNSGVFDMQARLGELALEMSILWLCGEDISPSAVERSTRSKEWKKARGDLGAALVQAQRVVGKRVKIGTIWPMFELGKTPLDLPMRTIRTFFAPLIDEALVRRAQGGTGAHLIDRLVHASDDRKLIEDQLINLLLASRDTTTSLLTFMIYALALHPEVVERLQRERQSLIGQDHVTKETVRDMRLGRAFINETLRLFPPVPLNIRRTLRASLLPTSDLDRPPLYMPANTSIILTTVLTHRDKAIWGDDAELFNIDRWANMGKEREAFTSWNIGPRMCLGQPLALTLAHTFLFYLLEHLNDGGQGRQLFIREEAKAEDCRMPENWLGPKGDGRARSGRDRVWIVSDVVLAVKGGLWVSLGEDR